MSNYDEWETTGWVFNKALDEVEVSVTVFYEVESEEHVRFPIIRSIGSYEDEDGYEQDYLLSSREGEEIYETIYEALQEKPIYDEYGGAL
tara:strand:+ start:523 stop:792 length:270 start_codon:yes stop_codon:yes gene_type:complete